MGFDPTHEMLRLLSGYWYSQVLYVVAELRLADCLAGGAKPAELLARETGCDAGSLARLLRALASAGLLRETSPETYELTPLCETLRSDRPDSLRSMALVGGHPLHWQAWGGLLQSVRTGAPAFDATHGTTFFDALRATPALSAAFQATLGRLHELDQGVVEALDLDRCRRMVDVGGGAGQLARRLASAHPGAIVTLFDEAHVLGGNESLDGVDQVAGNFLERVPAGGDAYFLKFVLHDWDDAQAVRILTNCRSAMAPYGRIFVIEVVVPESAEASIAKTHDINMLVLTGGRERTEHEYRALFADAGLDLASRSRTRHGLDVLEAQCAQQERAR